MKLARTWLGRGTDDAGLGGAAKQRMEPIATEPLIASYGLDAIRATKALKPAVPWGLVLQKVEGPRRPLINVRVESVGKRPPFRRALERRRCLVPADGFYEWKEEAGKVPHWIHPARGGLLSFAGIWDRWTDPKGETHDGFAILTTAANPDMAHIHGRMPVIVAPAERDAWLDRSLDASAALDLLRSVPAGELRPRAVSTRVNRTAEDDEGLIEPA